MKPEIRQRRGFMLGVSVCPSDGPPTQIAYGQTAAGTFTTDCQIVNHEFDGLSGDVVTIMYLGPVSTRRVRLFRDGVQLATTGAGLGVSITDFVLPADDTYLIVVEAQDGTTGSFSIGLNRLGLSDPIAINTPTAGSLDEIVEVDQWSFEATSGMTVTVDFSMTFPPETDPDPELGLGLGSWGKGQAEGTSPISLSQSSEGRLKVF